jgi:hypothetical protein
MIRRRSLLLLYGADKVKDRSGRIIKDAGRLLIKMPRSDKYM